MTRYAVFFSDEQGSGIQMVQAMDPGHAEDIVNAEHPCGHMSVIEASQLEGVNRTKVLLAWVQSLDGSMKPGGSPS
jgi:hypothetical protein